MCGEVVYEEETDIDVVDDEPPEDCLYTCLIYASLRVKNNVLLFVACLIYSSLRVNTIRWVLKTLKTIETALCVVFRQN